MKKNKTISLQWVDELTEEEQKVLEKTKSFDEWIKKDKPIKVGIMTAKKL